MRGVPGLAQLMVVLDGTVMNIALPSAQRALHFTQSRPIDTTASRYAWIDSTTLHATI